MRQEGRARDLLTLSGDGPPLVTAEDCFTARLSSSREILSIMSDPSRADIDKLIGARAGSQLRAAINETLPDEAQGGTPLYLLLDDIAGSSLVAAWAWALWTPDWDRLILEEPGGRERRRKMEGVCIGFAPGSSSLQEGPRTQQSHKPVGPLETGQDAYGWHELALQTEPAARRARRIDVRFEGQSIIMDAHFQDSATSPSGQRYAVHEYLLTVTADRDTLTIQNIVADPRILPFVECPGAILNLSRLTGTPLAGLRQNVLAELGRTQGCTHLNDMARSLAEVPQLAGILAAAIETKR